MCQEDEDPGTKSPRPLLALGPCKQIHLLELHALLGPRKFLKTEYQTTHCFCYYTNAIASNLIRSYVTNLVKLKIDQYRPGLLKSATQMSCRGLGSYASAGEGVTINRPIAKTIKLKLAMFVEATGKSTYRKLSMRRYYL